MLLTNTTVHALSPLIETGMLGLHASAQLPVARKFGTDIQSSNGVLSSQAISIIRSHLMP